MGYKLKAGDIFLVMTGNDKLWGTEAYATNGGHLDREALLWVLEHGIKLVGTDSWSFDRAYEEGTIAGILGTNLTYRSPELLAREWFHEVDLVLRRWRLMFLNLLR